MLRPISSQPPRGMIRTVSSSVIGGSLGERVSDTVRRCCSAGALFPRRLFWKRLREREGLRPEPSFEDVAAPARLGAPVVTEVEDF